MGSWVLLACMVGVALAPFSSAEAALNFYLKLKGQKSGDIKGSVAQKGREGRIAVVAISHEIISPRDAASGLATGKRTHKPLMITKEVDRSTPLINGLLVNNENLSEALFSVYEPNLKGGDSLVYSIKMTNASVTSVKVRTDADGKLVEDVSFGYQKIEWIWANGGVSFVDDGQGDK